jgi:hypothetical protein
MAANLQPALNLADQLVYSDPHHPNVARLGPKDLAVCRKDPLWEARHGVVDRVVCRKCGAMLKISLGSKPGHRWDQHHLSLQDYKAKYPKARRFSYQYIADLCGRTAQELMTRDLTASVSAVELAECRKDPAWEARRGLTDRVVCRKCGVMVKSPMGVKIGHLWAKHKTDRYGYWAEFPSAPLRSLEYIAKFYGRPLENLLKEIPDNYLLPDELAEARKNPAYEKDHELAVVICRVCGKKLGSELRARRGGHLGTHRLSMEEYRAKYPDAPWRSLAQIPKQKAARTRFRVKKAANEAAEKAELTELRALRTKGNGTEPASSLRRKSYTQEEIMDAIQLVRKMPSVAHRVAMRALNISESEFYRWIGQNKLRKYKKGFVYSAQVVRILDRESAERK